MLGLVVYNIQSSGAYAIVVIVALVLLGNFGIYLGKRWYELANELKEPSKQKTMDMYAEKEMNFENSIAIIEDAINDKNTFVIEKIENKEELRCMQKYIEMKISEKNSVISFNSILMGIFGIILAICAIGLTYYLTDEFRFFGVVIIVIAVIFAIWLYGKREYFNKIEKDNKKMHKLILRIENRLYNIGKKESYPKDIKPEQ